MNDACSVPPFKSHMRLRVPRSHKLIVNTDDNLWSIDIFMHGKCVGRLHGLRCGARFLLSDINLTGDSNKHRGFGSQLLDTLCSEAKAKGIAEVYGSVTHDDIKRTPGLLVWYQKHGFAVCEPDGECLSNAAKKIVWRLV